MFDDVLPGALRRRTKKEIKAHNGSNERITIYIPNKGQNPESTDPDDQIEFDDWEQWIWEAGDLCGWMNGGATTVPPASAFYVTSKKRLIEEDTVTVYSFIFDRARFREYLPMLREFLHRFGRNTNQETVFVEFDGFAFKIERKNYDGEIGGRTGPRPRRDGLVRQVMENDHTANSD
jgi:hypothetical protein